MRRPLVVGNWKMNTGRDDAVALAKAIARETGRGSVEVAVCPPYPWIVSVAESVDRATLRIGAQDCSANDDGAFTGDVSAAMLEPWCDLVLIGHSERRSVHGETDEMIRDKLRVAIAHGLDPVLCVGERAEDRAAGNASSFVTDQLDAALSELSASAFASLTIAYEPVWAIGTGATATTEDASEMAAVIRAWLRRRAPGHADTIRILYGGSVSDGSAAGLMAITEVDGLLVGGASLDVAVFSRIIAAASGRAA
ncbi:MAG: Triosephosphate isomerase [uncultured Thermomicrobiales bacterium]|uniref:Triosephosphate isomerase n=1 Tax=uncultured Thermomicrobiales bacterium TaxID=1645740 RepID=A0A6J4U7M4_9BACT|nr:MAG: Triosephosphate isomerase [uncultured Thermomicrobiales bacterium]